MSRCSKLSQPQSSLFPPLKVAPSFFANDSMSSACAARRRISFLFYTVHIYFGDCDIDSRSGARIELWDPKALLYGRLLFTRWPRLGCSGRLDVGSDLPPTVRPRSKFLSYESLPVVPLGEPFWASLCLNCCGQTTVHTLDDLLLGAGETFPARPSGFLTGPDCRFRASSWVTRPCAWALGKALPSAAPA